MNGYYTSNPYLYRCTWYLIDNSHRLLLGVFYYIFGTLSLILNLWLLTAFYKSSLLHTSKSHLLLLNLCVACLGRYGLAGFILAGTSSLSGRWIFGENCCQFFAFLRQFFNVWMVISLGLMGLERYLISRKISKDSELTFNFYTRGILFCLLYSAVFSLPPLFHFGNYKCDLTGTVCELDWRMTKQNVMFNWSVLVFGGVFPVLITLYCLNYASNRHVLNKQTYSRKNFTKTVAIVTATLFIIWLPQAVTILWIISGLAWSPRVFPVPLALTSAICGEIAGIIPVLCYLINDERVRIALMSMVSASVKKSREIFR